MIGDFWKSFVLIWIASNNFGALCKENQTKAAINSNETSTRGEVLKSSSNSSDLVAKSTNYRSPFENLPRLLCPGLNDPIRPFVSIPCKINKECSQLGNKNLLCCKNRCVKGILAPPPEPSHSPTWFGFVERTCPVEFLPEMLPIKKCHSDSECGGRICCPEKMPNGFVEGFCRTPQPKLDKLPAVKSFMEPMKVMMGYMQCTPPPPSLFDVFPRECNNILDCFPNLCCQERGKKFCRPPKRSLLTLLTAVAQRVIPENMARNIIKQLVP